MIEKSKQILLWGINLILKRYSSPNQDVPKPENLDHLLSALFGTTDIPNTDQTFYALHSIFANTGLCEQPGFSQNRYLHPNTNFELSPIIYPGSSEKLSVNFSEETLKILKNARIENDAEELLNILYKYGAHLPLFNEKDCSLPLYDSVKILAALASSESEQYRLVIGDLSGIQDFIYTISSEDALKVLRARSFFLELLTKSLAYDICEDNQVTSANILFSGGGNFLLLLPEEDGLTNKINSYYQIVNKFFLDEFEGNLHLPIVSVSFNLDELANIQQKWIELYRTLEKAKKQKFLNLLTDYYDPKPVKNEECNVCHTDAANTKISEENCAFCSQLITIAPKLKKIKHIYGIKTGDKTAGLYIPSIKDNEFWYYGLRESEETHRVFQVNRLELNNQIMMFYGDYVTEAESDTGAKRTADFQFLAGQSIGADLLATLVMDVDNMGLIFKEGLKLPPNRPQDFLILTHTLSRSLDYFFKFSLKELLQEAPETSFFRACPEILPPAEQKQKRQVTIVYSGGDDLLLAGAWSDVVECAVDIHEKFKAYICENTDIGLSGGIYLTQPNFPFYIAVSKAKEAEALAKGNFVELDSARPGYYQERDYSQTSIFDPKSNKLKLKDSITIFYDDNLDFMVKHLSNANQKDRYRLTLRWSEMTREIWGKPAHTVLKHLQKFTTNSLAKFDEAERCVKFEFPRSFLSKLYLMVQRYRQEKDGVYYLVDLVYQYSRLNRELRQKLNEIYEIYNRPEKKNENYILFLPVILNWLELLLRKKGEK